MQRSYIYNHSRKNHHMRWFAKKKDGVAFYQDHRWLQRWTWFYSDFKKEFSFHESKIKYLFVTKYYHEKRLDRNSFMYYLAYKVVGDERLSQFKSVLYVDKSVTIRVQKFDDNTQLNWLFPNFYSKTFGLSVRWFEFTFPNSSGSLNTFR